MTDEVSHGLETGTTGEMCRCVKPEPGRDFHCCHSRVLRAGESRTG